MSQAVPSRPFWRLSPAPGRGYSWPLVPSLASLAAAYLALSPVIFLIYGTLVGGDGPGQSLFASYLRAYTAPGAVRMLGNSVTYAAGAAVLSLLLGTILAWLHERTNTAFRGTLFILGIVPLILPGVLFTIAWIFLLSPNIGLVNLAARTLGVPTAPFNIYSLGGMIWVDGLHYSPFAFLMMSAAFRSMNPALEESAFVSGAGLGTTVRRITLRLMAPSLLSVFLLLFIRNLGTFEVPALIGRPAGIEVFTAKIWAATRRYPPDFGLAGVYALTLLLLTSVGLFVNSRLLRDTRRYATVTGEGFRGRVLDLGPWRAVTGAGVLAYLTIIALMPLAVLLWNSFLPFFMPPSRQALAAVTLHNYSVAFSYPQVARGLRNSLILAVGTAALTMLISASVAWMVVRSRTRGRWLLDVVATFPITLPGIVIGVGLIWTYLTLPVPIYGTLWILLIAYLTRFLPYGIRACGAALTQIHRELEDAGELSGGTWGVRFRRIVLPLLRPALIAGGTYILIVSVREFSSSVLLWGPRAEVLSVVLFDLWQSGLFQQVSAMGSALCAGLIVLAAAFWWVNRRQELNPG